MINEEVLHRKFGPGVIVKIEEKNGIILFEDNEERILLLPLVFEKGILTFKDSKKQQKYLKNLKKSKEKMHSEKKEFAPQRSDFRYRETEERKQDIKNISNRQFKKSVITTISQLVVGSIYTNKDIKDKFLVSGQGGMQKSNKTNSLVLISKHSTDLQRNPYEDRWISGILHYTGMGREGDQSLDYAQNKTLANSGSNGVKVYLFESSRSNEYKYLGKVRLSQRPYAVSEDDVNGKSRRVYKFPLELIG